MQRFLFAKVEAWVIVLLLLLGVLGLFGFGAAVLDTERGQSRFGAVGKAALSVAEVPATVERLLKAGDRMKTFLPDRWADRPAGWSIAPGPALPGYVLLSRFDADRGRNAVQLVRLADGSLVHEWLPDADVLLADAKRTSNVADFTGWNRAAWRAIHPFLTPEGDLIVKDHQSPLMRLDICGGRTWLNDTFMFHHSTESDGMGGFWIPSLIEPQSVDKVPPDFYEDALTHVAGDGTIIWQKSVTQILIDHGLEYAMFGAGNYDNDPIHMNDLQPVLEDGPYWKKGDLFISSRHLSMIMLYRPATDEIVWMKQGPWMAQHDVDIIDATHIATFDNRAYDRGKGPRVQGNNTIMVYDFATGAITEPYAEALKTEEVKTLFEGLFTILPDGTAMVEEENSGRLLFVTTDGATRATFINNGSDGASYRLGWSRWIDQAAGDAVAAKLAATTCAG
jgi:Arylsulfotransferase (ASST)